MSSLTIYVDEQSDDRKQFKNILIKDQKKDNNEYQIIVASDGVIKTNNNINYLILKKVKFLVTATTKIFLVLNLKILNSTFQTLVAKQ